MQMMGTSEQELLVYFICHEHFAAACSAYRHDMGVPRFDSCLGLPKVTCQGDCLKSELLLPA